MPDYQYFCHACQKTFSKVMTLAEHEEGEVLCPHCGSDNVEQSWSVFYPITPKKSRLRTKLAAPHQKWSLTAPSGSMSVIGMFRQLAAI